MTRRHKEAVAALTYSLRLYDNRPVRAEKVGDFEELFAAGYEAAEISGGKVAKTGEIRFKPHKWTFDGPAGKVYGWYLVDEGGELAAHGPFSPPYFVEKRGDWIEVEVVM